MRLAVHRTIEHFPTATRTERFIFQSERKGKSLTVLVTMRHNLVLELLSQKIREAFAILFPPQPLLGKFQSPSGDENYHLAYYLKR